MNFINYINLELLNFFYMMIEVFIFKYKLYLVILKWKIDKI